jgi:hypothetical protein
VNEDVLPRLPLNEAIALRGVEPLNDSSLSQCFTRPHYAFRRLTTGKRAS